MVEKNNKGGEIQKERTRERNEDNQQIYGVR